jgi:hypothetical protein
MTSLEDAYLRIVKKDQQISELYQIERDSSDKMDDYRAVRGEESAFSQFKAMYLRRMIVFTREPRQWFLTISPFANVLTTFLILYSLLNLS